MTAGEIAARKGEPEATVRTRLHRGVHQVREALDARHGGNRAAWAVALLPLAQRAKSAPIAHTAASSPVALFPILSSLLIMSTAAKLAVSAAILLAGALWWTQSSSTEAISSLESTETADIAAIDIPLPRPADHGAMRETIAVPAVADPIADDTRRLRWRRQPNLRLRSDH
ncbi:MAG: hypothetical protein ACI80K_004161 [Paracoccaceae bacterium]|jgi:hypothetical protein